MSQHHIRHSLFIRLPGLLLLYLLPTSLASLFQLFSFQLLNVKSTPTLNSEITALHIFPGVGVQSLSCVQLFAILRTVDHQAAMFMGFPKQEYWSGLPFPSPGPLSDPVIKLEFPSLPLSHQGSTHSLGNLNLSLCLKYHLPDNS